MAEDEFEQIAIKCVDEITSFNLVALDTQEVLSGWNTKLRELIEECDKDYLEVATANQALIKAIKDEVQEQSQEVGKITIATIIQMLLPNDVQNFASPISSIQFSRPMNSGGLIPRHSVKLR